MWYSPIDRPYMVAYCSTPRSTSGLRIGFESSGRTPDHRLPELGSQIPGRLGTAVRGDLGSQPVKPGTVVRFHRVLQGSKATSPI